jgi:hypothetical protein
MINLKHVLEAPESELPVETQHFENQRIVTQQVHCGAMEIHHI